MKSLHFLFLWNVYTKNSLKQGQEHNEEFLKQIKFESDNYFAFNMALNLMTTALKPKANLTNICIKKDLINK